MRSHSLKLTAFAIIGSVFLGACGGASPEVQSTAPPTTQAEANATLPEPTHAPTEAVETIAPEVQMEEDPVEIPMDKPAVRAGLSASNPSEVELAAGQLQLVEFFAFW